MRIKELIMKYDPGIKITLLLFHFIGFCFWISALEANSINIIAIVLTIGSGILLVIRELIKDGINWFLVTEGILTIVKIALLLTAFLLGLQHYFVLITIMLLGILSAHLPKQIKNKKIL